LQAEDEVKSVAEVFRAHHRTTEPTEDLDAVSGLAVLRFDPENVVMRKVNLRPESHRTASQVERKLQSWLAIAGREAAPQANSNSRSTSKALVVRETTVAPQKKTCA